MKYYAFIANVLHTRNLLMILRVACCVASLLSPSARIVNVIGNDGMLELPPAHAWDIDSYLQRFTQQISEQRHSTRSLLNSENSLRDIITDKYEVPKPTYLRIRHTDEAAGITEGSSDDIKDFKLRKTNKRKHSCQLFKDQDGCAAFLYQAPSHTPAPPRGNKSCPDGGCHQGYCHHDLGLCMCPAGWTGPTCTQELKRPCTHRLRTFEDPLHIPISFIHPVTKEGLNWTEPGWTASRCAGYCDDTIAMCYCGRGSKYAHVPAPIEAGPEADPISYGRPLADTCKPSTDEQGQWAGHNMYHQKGISWEEVYGPDGWCNSESTPVVRCGCYPEMTAGDLCMDRKEAFCPGQCAGHGECQSGFCKCDQGWYGTDCSRKRDGSGDLEPSRFETRKWLQAAVRLPAVLQAKAGQERRERKRPFIYVYDLPPEYNARMLQYKINPGACSWRSFVGTDNWTDFNYMDNGYSIETYLHEALLVSSHRTFDPEEADFFYVPVYITCFMWPVLGWADYPYYYAPEDELRPMHATNMLLEVKRWLQQHMPWWDRRGGRDHIWLMPHDEGACYMPTEIYNTSIVLTHWGRLDLDHTSGSGYRPDNYSLPLVWPGYQDTDWRELYKGHACFTPGKDLVIPLFKTPKHFRKSPLLGHAPMQRDIFLYFKGDVGLLRHEGYSRGIRQLYFRLAHEQEWRRRYSILISSGLQYKGDYSEHLSRSTFCLAVPGDGYSARSVDAILHGCIPVVVMDNVTDVFETILDWSLFSIRIKEADIHRTPDILMGISKTRVSELQGNLTVVWHRFAWAGSVLHRKYMPYLFSENHRHRIDHNLSQYVPRTYHYYPKQQHLSREDAFATLMQWLHGRIRNTR